MRRLLLSLLLAALLLLSACGGRSVQQPPEDPSGSAVEEPFQLPELGPFTLAVYPEYSLHPTLAANRANLTLAPLLYEPLFQVDGSFQAVPVLCRDYTVSEDMLSWRFTLHPEITFSNGEALTGQAVARALTAARASGSRYRERLQDVLSITGDEEGLTVVLRRPNGSLPLLLDIPIAFDTDDRPAGTGPYVLTESGDSLSLTARQDWWQRKVLPVQTIPLRSVRRSDELLLAFSAGEVSLADVDLMGTNTLGYSGSYEIWDYVTTDLIFLGFNVTRRACRDPEARLALARAVDRESIVNTSYAGHAVAAALPVHPDSPLYDPGRAGLLDYAPEELAGQLKQLRLDREELTLLVNSENAAKTSAAQFIAYQLESAGVKVNLRLLSFSDYTAALERGDFDLYLGEVVLTAGFDLSPLLSPGGALNYGQWTSQEISGLLSAFLAGGDGSQAAAALFDHLYQQVPIVPICFKSGCVLTQWGRLAGLSPLRGNVFWQFENWTIP